MKKVNKLVIILVVGLITFGSFLLPTKAQTFDVCDFFPCTSVFGGEGGNIDTIALVGNIVKLVGSLIFIGFIGFGILIIIQNSLKMIRSEGDQSEVEAGFKGMRAVYIGVVMLIVGLIGLVILFAVLGGGSIPDVTIEKPEGIENIPLI